jgi:hypothetical protein
MKKKQSNIRSFEYIHIPLWLIKDTCWMLDLKILGTVMIVPTFLVAVYLVRKTRGMEDFFVNLAVLCWISANAWWMCCEFYDMMNYKNLAGIPFVMGMLAIAGFYLKKDQRLES